MLFSYWDWKVEIYYLGHKYSGNDILFSTFRIKVVYNFHIITPDNK